MQSHALAPRKHNQIKGVPQDLLHHSSEIRQRLLVIVVGQPMAANDAVQFRLSLALDLWKPDHGKDEGAEGRYGLHTKKLSVEDVFAPALGSRYQRHLNVEGDVVSRRFTNEQM